MSPPARTDGRTTETRERILVAAEELIAAHGVEGFQLKDVAAAVGIRPPSVFAHFKGREAIADEVAVRIVARIGELLGEALASAPDPMSAVRAAVRSLVAHLWTHPAHVRLLLRDLVQPGAGASGALSNSPTICAEFLAFFGPVALNGRPDLARTKASRQPRLSRAGGSAASSWRARIAEVPRARHRLRTAAIESRWVVTRRPPPDPPPMRASTGHRLT